MASGFHDEVVFDQPNKTPINHVWIQKESNCTFVHDERLRRFQPAFGAALGKTLRSSLPWLLDPITENAERTSEPEFQLTRIRENPPAPSPYPFGPLSRKSVPRLTVRKWSQLDT